MLEEGGLMCFVVPEENAPFSLRSKFSHFGCLSFSLKKISFRRHLCQFPRD